MTGQGDRLVTLPDGSELRCECPDIADEFDRYCPIHGDDEDYEEDDLDPCNYCPHDNTRHRGDGCMDCGCAVPQ